MNEAVRIYQAFLDDISAAVMSGDGGAVADRMLFPQRLGTRDGFLDVTDRAQMIGIVKDYHEFLLSQGTTDYHRICKMSAVSDAGAEITGEHETHILRGASHVAPPFRSRMVLRRRGGAWLGAGNTADISNSAVTILSPAQLRAAREGGG